MQEASIGAVVGFFAVVVADGGKVRFQLRRVAALDASEDAAVVAAVIAVVKEADVVFCAEGLQEVQQMTKPESPHRKEQEKSAQTLS